MISNLFSWLASKIGALFTGIWDAFVHLVQKFTSWLASLFQYILDWVTQSFQTLVTWFWGLASKCVAWLADLFIGDNPDVAYNVVTGVNYMRTALERWNEFVPVHEAITLAGIYVTAYIAIKSAATVWRIILAVLP